MVSKYSALSQFLADAASNEVNIPYSEIEVILQFALPNSAHIHRPWWANDLTHVQARDGWLCAGWVVHSADLKAKKVSFQRNIQNTIPKEKTEPRPKRVGNFVDFENQARALLSTYFNVVLKPGQIDGVPKLFDLVSPDGKIVGDAKYFTLVRGSSPPPAKFSVIAEHVWLLEKTAAETKFLVFGNDKRVPIKWLQKYGGLTSTVDFYFIDDEGKIESLKRGARLGF